MASVMNDLFEYILTSLNFGLVKGLDTTFDGHRINAVIAEEINTFIW